MYYFIFIISHSTGLFFKNPILLSLFFKFPKNLTGILKTLQVFINFGIKICPTFSKLKQTERFCDDSEGILSLTLLAKKVSLS